MFGLGVRAVGQVLEVGERLVVELEQRVGVAGHGIVPAAGVPRPREVLGIQAVADVRHRLGRQELLLP